MTETRATLRYYHASASKTRQVLGLIHGRDVEDARRVLRFCERGAAEPVLKLLESAISNAEHNSQIPSDELFVQEAYAHEGPTSKRFKPRARGRAAQIKKRTSHITIVLDQFSDDALRERSRREALAAAAGKRSRTPLRRRTRVRPDHDHDHEDAQEPEELDNETAATESAEKPASKPRRATKKAKAVSKETAEKPAKATKTAKATKKAKAAPKSKDKDSDAKDVEKGSK